ncbi:MAG: N-acetyl-gamma-glutamyl-phosphate reductase, partial [Luteibaculum sp.]
PRGIMINLYTTCNKDLDTLRKLYADFYAEHPLSHVSETPIHLKQVTNTAKALIHVDKHDDQVLVSCAIDNLLKGASGQAVQNMNLMFGFAENTGLKLKGNYF